MFALASFPAWLPVSRFPHGERSETETGARCAAPDLDFESRLRSFRSSQVNRLSRSHRTMAWTKIPSADTRRLRVVSSVS